MIKANKRFTPIPRNVVKKLFSKEKIQNTVIALTKENFQKILAH